MGDQAESDEEELDVAEEKPKTKKKGKSSPAANRKERSATPEVGVTLSIRQVLHSALGRCYTQH